MMERLPGIVIDHETADRITRYKLTKRVTTNETIRRAVELLDLVTRRRAEGAEVVFHAQDGSEDQLFGG